MIGEKKKKCSGRRGRGQQSEEPNGPVGSGSGQRRPRAGVVTETVVSRALRVPHFRRPVSRLRPALCRSRESRRHRPPSS